MAQTPEGKVKAALRGVLDELPKDHLTRSTPATGGFGKSGVSDDVGTVASLVVGHLMFPNAATPAPVGLSWAIESKGDKAPTPTPGSQTAYLVDNAKLGAFCAVLSSKGFRLYDRSGVGIVYHRGENETMKALARRLVEILRSSVWAAPDFKADQLQIK